MHRLQSSILNLLSNKVTNDCVFIDDSLVSYKLKKQQTVSRYFTEAKYRSMENATYEMVWLMSLFKDLGVSHEGLAMLFCDNQATLHIAANPVFHKRIKHIKIGCHLVQEKIQNRTFSTPRREREPWLSQEENGGVRQGKGLGSVSQPKEPPFGSGRGSWGVVRNILVEKRGVEGAVGLERREKQHLGEELSDVLLYFVPCEAL
ncbi:Retrovirus-related Pol polyprotein from transposon RE1 [Vitis vinifera]|uniref:Retrovirus-related Pol polyprotein from transposon RE1 n=1 Tax=Vitis vinifera TaxID=29760 RepID=A0A438KFE3_VITVI|nr:Retrovirus-related Pol polyprotein from transposon RE1 [Vitis vinifera]